MIFFYLFSLFAYPNQKIISDKLIMGIVLALISYIWTQEVRDRSRLQILAMDLVESKRKLQEAQVDMISSLILMEEAKDPYVHGHSYEVMRASVALGEYLMLPKSSLEILKHASLLHDLGKLIVKEDILNKKDQLTDHEWDAIKEHPQIAVDILEPLKFLEEEQQIILHHHERIDGKGYPSGLKGEAIPLGSRIIAIADTFDAMNSARVYRKRSSQEEILEELWKVAGSQLDVRLVTKFLELLRAQPELWVRSDEKDKGKSGP